MMSCKEFRIAIVVGEASGDILASHLMRSLKALLPNVSFFGIGGGRMLSEGFRCLFPSEKLAVNGYIEVLKHYSEISGIRRQLKKALLLNPPDLFIGVDAPDFNIGLEKSLSRSGIKTLHYVSPSVWAWRRGRIPKIAASTDHLFTIFPFEADCYKATDLSVTYVGHPLADVIPLEDQRSNARAKLRIPQGTPVFALLPGSRQSEVEHMAETFANTAKVLAQKVSGALFLVPLATRETRVIFDNALRAASVTPNLVRVMFGHSHEAMAAADVVLVASGTATLEAALFKRPMVIAYKLAPISYKLMKRLGYLPYVGLPNILAKQFVVPEFIQDDATPENLAQALANLYSDRQTCSRIRTVFDNLHLQLRCNNAQKAAESVLNMLGIRRD